MLTAETALMFPIVAAVSASRPFARFRTPNSLGCSADRLLESIARGRNGTRVYRRTYRWQVSQRVAVKLLRSSDVVRPWRQPQPTRRRALPPRMTGQPGTRELSVTRFSRLRHSRFSSRRGIVPRIVP
jgi:hypothetical protein